MKTFRLLILCLLFGGLGYAQEKPSLHLRFDLNLFSGKTVIEIKGKIYSVKDIEEVKKILGAKEKLKIQNLIIKDGIFERITLVDETPKKP